MPIITEDELQKMETEHKKRKYEKKEKIEQNYPRENPMDTIEKTITMQDVKAFWKNPKNFEDIKKTCAVYGIDWKNISDENKHGIVNIITKERSK